MGSRWRDGGLVAVGTGALLLVGCGEEARLVPGGPDQSARVLEAALARIGGPPASIDVRSSGTLDKGPEGQGFTLGGSSAGSFRERIAVEPARRVAAREYREERYDGSFEHVREVWGPEDSTLIVLPAQGLAIHSTDPGAAGPRYRVRRRIPHLLLAELLEAQERLGGTVASDSVIHVEADLDGRIADLTFRRSDSIPLGIAFEESLEGLGPGTIRWSWTEWRPVDELLLFPQSVEMTIDGHPYLQLRSSSVETPIAGPGPDPFAAPDSLRRIEVPADGDEPGTGAAELRVEEILPGVHRVHDVRGGFSPIFVELEESVVAVDAPAGFPLLPEIPPGHTDPAPHWSVHSERYVDAIRRTVPDKPIRLVLTHGHQDHIGGVRAFVAAGAEIYGPPSIRGWVESLASGDAGIGDDRLAATPELLEWRDVTAPETLGRGERTVRILPVGENPHAEGMLVVHLPHAELIFVSDLVTPAPLERYPGASHAALDRFFARWLEREGLDPERVLAMHGNATVTPAHRERLLREGPPGGG